MASGPINYESSGLGAAKDRSERLRKQKTKREQAADMFNAARKLAREALEEENAEAEKKKVSEALAAEYGPPLK